MEPKIIPIGFAPSTGISEPEKQIVEQFKVAADNFHVVSQIENREDFNEFQKAKCLELPHEVSEDVERLLNTEVYEKAILPLAALFGISIPNVQQPATSIGDYFDPIYVEHKSKDEASQIRKTNVHIKRDGQMFCGLKKAGWYITFKEAHSFKEDKYKKLCPECEKIYYDKLSRLKNPIVL